MNDCDDASPSEPGWLVSMRATARQRPRTQFQRIRWAQLQSLLRERDALWNAATAETRAMVEAMRETDQYAYKPPLRAEEPIGEDSQDVLTSNSPAGKTIP